MSETTVISKTPRWIKVTLVVSLALNLLVAGAVGASVFWPHMRPIGEGPHGGLARPAAMQTAARHLMWKLPRERRRALFALIVKHRRAMQPELNALADSRLALAKLLTSSSATTAELQAELLAVRNAESALHDKAAGLTKAYITSLSEKERRLYGQILQDPPRKRWFGHHERPHRE